MITSGMTIAEARSLANGLIEQERGCCGGNVQQAIHRVSTKYGVQESHLRSLRYRSAELKAIPAQLLEQLRCAFEAIHEKSRTRLRHEIAVCKITASSLDDDLAGELRALVHKAEATLKAMDT
jgi:biotin synthase-related radical SAM superfamily protein